jgi:hypothetical protein
VLLHPWLLICVQLYFPFWRRLTPPQCPHIFCSLMETPAILFAISSPSVSLKILLSDVLLPRHGSCLLLCPVMSLPFDLSFPRHSCYLEPWFLIQSCLPVSPDIFSQTSVLSGSSCNIVLALFLTIVSFMPCRKGTVVHPSVGGRQLLLGPTIALGPLLWLTAAP